MTQVYSHTLHLQPRSRRDHSCPAMFRLSQTCSTWTAQLPPSPHRARGMQRCPPAVFPIIACPWQYHDSPITHLQTLPFTGRWGCMHRSSEQARDKYNKSASLPSHRTQASAMLESYTVQFSSTVSLQAHCWSLQQGARGLREGARLTDSVSARCCTELSWMYLSRFWQV